jgi:DNA primase
MVVEELLNSKGVHFKASGKDLLITCLNPEHEDANPSTRVSKETGVFHCFSCGFKGNIFKHFGINSMPSSMKVLALRKKLRELTTEVEIEWPYEVLPFTQPFRSISTATLKKFGAFYTRESEYENRIIFPVKDLLGRTTNFVARHLLSSANPKYLAYPHKKALPIFPEVLEQRSESVVLVEGIFDMLNLYDKGIKNVVCSFGTSTLNKEAASKLMPLKSQGVKKVFIMYDGDEPGKKAAQALKPLLEDIDFEVEILELEEDTDPGELTAETVKEIKEYINGENSDN